MFENPRRGSQARNFTTNVPKILDLKSSEQIFSRKLSLGAPDYLYICHFFDVSYLPLLSLMLYLKKKTTKQNKTTKMSKEFLYKQYK